MPEGEGCGGVQERRAEGEKYPERGKYPRWAVELPPCVGQNHPPPHPPSMGVGLRGIVRCVRDRAAYTVGKGRWERDGHEGVNKRGRGRSVRGRGQARGACPTSGKAVGRGRRQSERRLADGR